MIYAPERPELNRTPVDEDTARCPDCQGEMIIHRNPRREPDTGVWVSDEVICTRCSGTGSVPADEAILCRWCPTSLEVGTHCPEHDDLCDEHRPRGCGDCADQ